jgi:hypothetical protein
MRKYLLYTAVTIFAGVFIGDSVLFGQSDKPFSGKPLPQMLQSSTSVYCFSDTAATMGYYRSRLSPTPEATLTSSALKKQSTGGGYRITFHSDRALVFDEFAKESFDFIVFERRTDGVILIRPKGVGVEVITIDPVNGSFRLN